MSEDLFSFAEKYPHVPGWKRRDTAAAAAEDMRTRSPTLRDACLALLRREAFTADELAARLEKTPFAIRPRITELSVMGEIEDTGDRRPNASGKLAIVWRGAPCRHQGTTAT